MEARCRVKAKAMFFPGRIHHSTVDLCEHEDMCCCDVSSCCCGLNNLKKVTFIWAIVDAVFNFILFIALAAPLGGSSPTWVPFPPMFLFDDYDDDDCFFCFYVWPSDFAVYLRSGDILLGVSITTFSSRPLIQVTDEVILLHPASIWSQKIFNPWGNRSQD